MELHPTRAEANPLCYLYKDPKNGLWRYAGVGKALKRALYHRGPNAKTNPQLKNLIRARRAEGYEMMPVIIDIEGTFDDAKEFECLLIEMIGREDLGTGSLFNKTPGGDGGAIHSGKGIKRKPLSAEHKAKIATAGRGRKHSDETKHKIGAVWRGKTRPTETVEKMRVGRTGKLHTAETKAKMSISRRKNGTNS